LPEDLSKKQFVMLSNNDDASGHKKGPNGKKISHSMTDVIGSYENNLLDAYR
jgi:hypothetical protein